MPTASLQPRSRTSLSSSSRNRHQSPWLSWLTAVGLTLAVGAPAWAQEGGREIRIRVGEQETLSAEGVRSYSEGVRGIADVRLTERQDRFIIAGMRPGTTSLLLIMRDGSQVQYRIIVESDQASGTTTEIREGAVPARQNIRLDLYFVQLRDTYGHSIGIDYPVTFGTDQDRARINPQWTQGVGWNTTIQIISQTALPRVDIAQSRGWARLYRQAALVSVNGGESEINIGGELNVITPGQLTQTLNQIPFGTILRATPQYDDQSGRIQIRLEADVSDLAEDGGTGVPGRTRSTLNTTVNLELGQSIVLGGVIARSESRSRSGLPGLSQIPILGAFFGVHGRRFEEAETLLFIVPTIIEPLPLTQRNRIQEAIRMYEEFSGGVDEVDLLEQPRAGGSAPRTVVDAE